jgi:hypothetical protein
MAEADNDGGGRDGVIVGITGATVLATGVLLAYRHRRQPALHT